VSESSKLAVHDDVVTPVVGDSNTSLAEVYVEIGGTQFLDGEKENSAVVEFMTGKGRLFPIRVEMVEIHY